MFSKQSSPNTDQDYSSNTFSCSTETKPLDIFPNENRYIQQYKTDFVLREHSQSKIINDNFKENKPMITPVIKNSKLGFNESIIDNIDGYITPNLGESEHDFDISDIDDAMRITNHDEDLTNMDEDSLENSEGVLENKKKPAPAPPSSIISIKKPTIPKIKSGGICTALYLAQKQKQASADKKEATISAYKRSNTLPNVIEAIKKEEQIHRKSSAVAQRSQSTDLFDKHPSSDSSKLDRDSGFDEQDFRCERLHSSYDDNSSVSSLKSVQSSIGRSLSSDLNGQTYRENKAYELRLKALDYTRTLNQQLIQDPRLNSRRNFNYTSTRTNETNYPITHRYKKNNQLNFYLKYQQ
jgi:hypothetical protein